MLPDLQLICHPPSNGGVVWRIDVCANEATGSQGVVSSSSEWVGAFGVIPRPLCPLVAYLALNPLNTRVFAVALGHIPGTTSHIKSARGLQLSCNIASEPFIGLRTASPNYSSVLLIFLSAIPSSTSLTRPGAVCDCDADLSAYYPAAPAHCTAAPQSLQCRPRPPPAPPACYSVTLVHCTRCTRSLLHRTRSLHPLPHSLLLVTIPLAPPPLATAPHLPNPLAALPHHRTTAPNAVLPPLPGGLACLPPCFPNNLLDRVYPTLITSSIRLNSWKFLKNCADDCSKCTRYTDKRLVHPTQRGFSEGNGPGVGLRGGEVSRTEPRVALQSARQRASAMRSSRHMAPACPRGFCAVKLRFIAATSSGPASTVSINRSATAGWPVGAGSGAA
ncbi:hypothetical protein DFH08DRAFT_826781 [Mycena albidolilacea]|uniref:Uncharacterized protein n=1 Tax=Mycena albidolilacea TaxID=1033008 RepID=A0AAD6YZH6_9AGAR|nr:hypothetical protein DFH08DRAFT_826781 [Mycena albidolilacea]